MESTSVHRKFSSIFLICLLLWARIIESWFFVRLGFELPLKGAHLHGSGGVFKFNFLYT